MNIRYIILLGCLVVSLLLVRGVVAYSNHSATTDPYTTFLLTDRNVTAGGSLFHALSSHSGPESNHVIWFEGLQGPGYGMFYRHLPLGATEQVPDLTISLSGPIFRYVVVDQNDVPAILFAKDDNGQGTDLYLWRPGDTQITRLTDPVLSMWHIDYSSVNAMFDSMGNLHVVWVERGPNFAQVFYWSEPLSNTIVISDETEDPLTVDVVNVAEHDDIIHVGWRQRSQNDGLSNVYYWDSVTTLRRILTEDQPFLSDGVQLQVDGNGDAHLTWLQAEAGNNCLLYWTPVLTQPVTLTNGAATCYGNSFDGLLTGVDMSGTFRLLHLGHEIGDMSRYALYTWSPGDPGLTAYNIDAFPLFYDLKMSENGTFYAVWERHFSIIYWDSDTGVKTTIIRPELVNDLVYEVDSSDTAHMMWVEEHDNDMRLFYYNDVDEVVVNLSDAIPSAVDVSSFSLEVTPSDTVHVGWWEDQTSPGVTDFFYWNSGLISPQLVYQDQHYFFNGPNQFEVYDDDTAYAVWLESVVDEESNIFVWSSQHPPIGLSKNYYAAGSVTGGHLAFDDSGQAYIFWEEEVAPNGQEDFFAAFIFPELPFNSYVPALSISIEE